MTKTPGAATGRIAPVAAIALLGTACAGVAGTLLADEFGEPVPVEITGYVGDAMEPFLTRDGRFLIFNDSNAEPDANLHYAERVDDHAFSYRGELAGANSPAFDAVPSADAAGGFFFVSLRSYPQTLASLYRGTFAEGAVSQVEPLPGLAVGVPGWVNFDAEISWDGAELAFVDGYFESGRLPESADIVLAELQDGAFVRAPESASWLAAVNGAELEYAPSLSPDRLELLFTRFTIGVSARIYRSYRAGFAGPFGPPEELASLGDFVEAPAFTADALAIYFHGLDGAHFRIYRAVRTARPIVFADAFEGGLGRWSAVVGDS